MTTEDMKGKREIKKERKKERNIMRGEEGMDLLVRKNSCLFFSFFFLSAHGQQKLA